MSPTRRSFVQRTVFTLVALAAQRLGFAQSRASRVQREIDANVAQVAALRAEIRKVGVNEMNVDRAQGFANREADLRRRLAGTLGQVPPSGLDEYVLPEQKDLVDALRKDKHALAPKPEEIDTIKVSAPPKLPRCKESLQSIAFEIVLGALGASPDIRDVLLKVIDESPELKQRLEDLTIAVRAKNIEQTIDILTAIASLLADTTAGKAITQAGRAALQKVALRVLPRFAARLVPFVGPAYIAANAATLTYVNWDRIVAAANC